jgi:hypothetical protein
MYGLRTMPQCPCQLDPCDKRRPLNAVHLQTELDEKRIYCLTSRLLCVCSFTMK